MCTYRRHPFVPKSPPNNHHIFPFWQTPLPHYSPKLLRSHSLSLSLPLPVALHSTIHKRRQTENAHARFPLQACACAVRLGAGKQTQNYAFHFAPRVHVCSLCVCLCVRVWWEYCAAFANCDGESGTSARVCLVVVVYGKLYVLVHALARNTYKQLHDTPYTHTHRQHPNIQSIYIHTYCVLRVYAVCVQGKFMPFAERRWWHSEAAPSG